MSDAREEVLGRVRAALADLPPGTEIAVPRDYQRASDQPPAARVERFCERTGEYQANVVRVGDGELAAAVAEACARHGARRLGVPLDLPAGWRPANLELVEDRELPPHELDRLDGAITGCALAIADTGTIVLAAGPGEGRRALSLVPDLHVCVVPADRVVGSVPEAIAALAPAVADRRPITFISGPSATSDIELNRVEGVHGPRELEVLVAG
jgi:L-lactate dehydrogenase complex protein LldG